MQSEYRKRLKKRQYNPIIKSDPNDINVPKENKFKNTSKFLYSYDSHNSYPYVYTTNTLYFKPLKYFNLYKYGKYEFNF